jgi:hypothetical protein
MRFLVVGLFVSVSISMFVAPACSETPQQAERYQLISASKGTVTSVASATVTSTYLVDTATGRVWHLLSPSKEKDEPQCTGFSSCFFELDRMQWTPTGYKSEIFLQRR